MKILMLIDTYIPITSGAVTYVQSLGRELIQMGHQIIVCAPELKGQPVYQENEGLKTYRIQGLISRMTFLYRSHDQFPPPVCDPILSKNLRILIEKEKPDIIHAHGWMIQSVIPILKNRTIPLVLTLHDYRAICPAAGMISAATVCNMSLDTRCVSCCRQLYGNGLFGMLKCLALYFATKFNKNRLKNAVQRFIAVSSYVKNIHQSRLNLQDTDIITIPNFYSRDTNEEIKSTGSLPEEFILFVGRLVPEKGVDVLIEAFRKLNSEIKLVIIGAKGSIHFGNNENIVLIENAPYDTVKEAYRKCRFAVFPSIWPEPCATVVFEAMSYKKAVIASRIGGFTDVIIDGETGILVLPGDVIALSQAIKRLLENPELTREMGNEAFLRWQQNFTANTVVPKIEELYIALINNISNKKT